MDAQHAVAVRDRRHRQHSKPVLTSVVNLTLDMGWLTATLLLSARVAGATMLAPVLGPAQIPAPARVVLVLALSALIASLVHAPIAAFTNATQLALAMGAELLLGATFSFGFIAAYAATQVAGRLLDIQMGFGAASVLNPTTQTPAPLIGSLLGMVFVAVFLSLDGHHVLVKALALSVESLPLGAALDRSAWNHLLSFSGIAFSFGLALAAPVMFALLLADVALAIFARTMPQLNVFVLSFSIKVILGIAGLALSIRFSDTVLIALAQAAFGFWGGLAGA
jgi:flagellar biosynthesis protein FliR